MVGDERASNHYLSTNEEVHDKGQPSRPSQQSSQFVAVWSLDHLSVQYLKHWNRNQSYLELTLK